MIDLKEYLNESRTLSSSKINKIIHSITRSIDDIDGANLLYAISKSLNEIPGVLFRTGTTISDLKCEIDNVTLELIYNDRSSASIWTNAGAPEGLSLCIIPSKIYNEKIFFPIEDKTSAINVVSIIRDIIENSNHSFDQKSIEEILDKYM